MLGFGDDSVLSHFESSRQTSLESSIRSETLNYFLSISSGFRIDRIEFYNAMDLWNRCVASGSTFRPSAALFFACLRLSVFWRRRKDILTHNKDSVVNTLQVVNAPIERIQEAESEVLSRLGCHVWDSDANVVEVVYITLDRVQCNEVNVVKDIGVDIAHILTVSPGTSEFSTWYVIVSPFHSRIDRERGVACVLVAMAVLTQSFPAKVLNRVGSLLPHSTDRSRLKILCDTILNLLIK